MRILIALAVVVLGYVFFQGIRMYVLLQRGVQLAEQSVVYEQQLTGGAPRLLIVGDSTAVGTGVHDPKLSVAGRFGAEFPAAFIKNTSGNGWKVADALKNFPDVSAKSFDVVLLQIGANDILWGTPMAQFRENLTAVFKKATAAGKKVYALHSGNVGLAPIFPWPISSIMSARSRTYRAEYMRIAAEEGVTYVDLYSESHYLLPKKEFYAEDGLHLTAKGYEEWFQAIRRVMGTSSGLERP